MEVDYMDVATMVAINNLNMVTVMAVQAANNVITIVNGERMEEDMDGSMLDQYMGKECTISLFNEVGAIKGKLMDGYGPILYMTGNIIRKQITNGG